ncbi:MAG: replicative DNA helicase [Dehalococcoidales bacterium]|jgi:replicative DNA helicase|nr:replicative DNA helicase [Dehalococcoidales bacterium]
MNGEKLPPHDVDAEEAVIGSLLIDGSAIFKVAPLLVPLDNKSPFYTERNAWIYDACLSLYERDEAINQITVAQELDRQGKLEACGGAAYLSRLISICPTSLDIEDYAQIVYRLSVMRRLIDAAGQINNIAYRADPDVDRSLNDAEDILFRLRHGRSRRDLTHIRQVLDTYFETTALEKEGAPREQLPYVLSGFAGLDELLGGFQRSELIIVGGRPSMGKTSLALSLARNAAVEQGACVALFSLEMAREPLVWRILASESEVDSRRIRLGLHTEEQEKRIMDAIGQLSEAKIYIDDTPQLRVVEMRSKARRLHFEQGIDMIIVDYLQLMQGDRRFDNRVQEVSEISRALKGLARELNVPLLAVSQLSRAPEGRASHEPLLSDLRESGSIEQDADVVIFVYRDEYYYTSKEDWEREHPGESYPPPADIIISKNRNGPTDRVKLLFKPKMAKFDNITNEELSLL